MAHTGSLMTMKLYDSTYMREPTQEWLLRVDDSNKLTWCGRHHMFILTFNNNLFLAPIRNPRRVIDVGTGIGIWASCELQPSFEDRIIDVS